ncbi:class I SAM-dependent methyltransferase [Micromonospora sp. WMMD882]|uniref:class I SAM-dependent methyltransferase n=1 Tax=Micromonospora sp. WMMD882 TaxID=3015151 RepID=UPI00248BACC7|nr:class I SAM-dependent methyltransferase [Micromonospora sp. WMMD882]WBB78707.1 class I SAM-dependent methyltransferase [Micromonospora sp. WMMD882]
MSGEGVPPTVNRCRVCDGEVQECLDFGRQPVSSAFVDPDGGGAEVFYRLAVGFCTTCTLVQQLEEVPRDAMFRVDYPYRSSESALMRKHFEQTARHLLESELTGPDPFVVEVGSNDGIMLQTVADAGIRHLGVDPSRDAAETARDKGIQVQVEFFEEASARRIRAAHGPADVIFSANTISHIAYIDSIFRGVDALLAPTGIFVFEDRYLADIIEHNYFDQIYDEHFYLFSIHSVHSMAERFGFELVDAERLTVHGGAVRFTVARTGARRPSAAVAELLAREQELGLGEAVTYERFASHILRTRDELTALLRDLRSKGHRIVAYGATAKSATVANFCDIGPDLVDAVYDSTPEKQGRLTPGSHIPVRPPQEFAAPYPDYALLFAWNHAEEIMAKERGFREHGGRWIMYVPDVHIV